MDGELGRETLALMPRSALSKQVLKIKIHLHSHNVCIVVVKDTCDTANRANSSS